MIEQLTVLLQRGGTWRVSDLARRLDTTPGLVEMMLQELAERGYVKPWADTCAVAPCSGCALSGACTGHESPTHTQWISTQLLERTR